MSKVQPLKKKTMTLSQLQMRTLDVLKKMRLQLNRQGFEDGMSDREFISQVLATFEADIRQDRHVIKMSLKS